jgi:hypothetical protein
MYVHRRSNLLRMAGEADPAGAWLNPALLPGTMAIQGNKQPRYCTKNKTYGCVQCSMGVALVLPPPLPSGRIQVDTLGLLGRDLPSRVEVVLRHFHRSHSRSSPLWIFCGEGL